MSFSVFGTDLVGVRKSVQLHGAGPPTVRVGLHPFLPLLWSDARSAEGSAVPLSGRLHVRRQSDAALPARNGATPGVRPVHRGAHRTDPHPDDAARRHDGGARRRSRLVLRQSQPLLHAARLTKKQTKQNKTKQKKRTAVTARRRHQCLTHPRWTSNVLEIRPDRSP